MAKIGFIFISLILFFNKPVMGLSFTFQTDGFSRNQLYALDLTQRDLLKLNFSGCVVGWLRTSHLETCEASSIADFINKRVSRLIFQHSFAVAQNLTLANPALYPGGQVAVSSAFFSILHPIDRIATLLHEAKHTDHGGMFHSGCAYNNELLFCDNSEDGPNGIQIAFYLNLFFYCENCDPKLREQAGAWALDRMTRVSSFFPSNAPDLDSIFEFAQPKGAELRSLAENYFSSWDKKPR